MMDSSKTLNGAFGTLYHEGEWLTNVTGVEISSEINYEEIMRAGTRKVGHKPTTVTSSGTISSYKLTHNFVKLIAQIMDDKKGAFVTELTTQISDPDNPEAGGFIRLKGVQFNTIPILSYEHGSIVEEELQFVFDDFEFL